MNYKSSLEILKLPPKEIILIIFIIAAASDVFAESSMVDYVIDGNTIRLTNGENVRLMGVDASVGGSESTVFLSGLFEASGKNITLERGAQKEDDAGRALAYVWVIRTYDQAAMTTKRVVFFDKTQSPHNYWEIENEQYTHYWLINAAMIAYGYAKPVDLPADYPYAGLFQNLFQEARQNGQGIWKSQSKLNLKKIKKLCAFTGGFFMDCAAAFAMQCENPMYIEGKQVICSCPEGKVWDLNKGCY